MRIALCPRTQEFMITASLLTEGWKECLDKCAVVAVMKLVVVRRVIEQT
jgi:hypothetical protein